ncbi:MAG: cell division protein ZapA [Thermodesulfovibrionales bacterium]|nr:cell division protein ZapA [Thermodesulfovibrionales bacterium]
MGSVEVYILGQKYTIRGDKPPEYIKQLADHVDMKLREVCSNIPNLTPLKAVILASLSIADELYTLKRDYEAISNNIIRIGEKANAILNIIESD